MTDQVANAAELGLGMPADTADVDIGHGVTVHFVGKGATYPEDAPDRVGVIVAHPAGPKDGGQGDGRCAGAVFWYRPPGDPPRPIWTLHSLEPLHLEPSILCSCGFHGFIRAGRWVPA